MKTRTTIIALSVSAFLIILCDRKDTIYDPQDREPARCFALLSDTVIANPSLGDTSHLATCDTIHTNDTVAFIGMVTPADADLKSVKWDFGDGKEAQEAITVHCYSKGGVYTGVFTIEDKVGITLSDTVVVHVNTRPRKPMLLSPENGQKGINPNDDRVLRWSCGDADGDTLKYQVFFNSSNALVSPFVMVRRDTTTSILSSNFKKLTTYYWCIKAIDLYSDSAASDTFKFSTRDPDATTGWLEGYALFAGWKSHTGIKISVVDSTNLVNPQYTHTDNAGFFRIEGLPPKTYKVIAHDTLKGEFLSDSTRTQVIVGDVVSADTLRLKDPFKPVISNNIPNNTQTIRRPQISADFSDRGSGILVSSANIVFNDSNVTSEASVTDSGIQWTPSARLPDNIYGIAVSVTDSVGNRADTLKWTFTVDAMSLSILTPDTTVRINDTVRIRSIATDVYSKVAQYKWDFEGDGTWDDSATVSDTVISRPHVYTHEAQYKAAVYAKDDSGMVKLDTVTITVGNQPPVISSIRADTTISIKDSIQLSGAATDNDGTITEYAWDYDGDGTFEYTSATEITTGHRYNTAGSYNAVMRVTDDDNKVTKDTAMVTVLQDAPQITFRSSDTVIERNGAIRCSVYISQQFGTMEVDIDTANSGSYKTLGGLVHTGGKSYMTPTGNECSWDSVKVRVTDDDGNVVVRGFKVDIWPQPLTITAIDSTDTTITIRYTQTQESDFAQYRIYRGTGSAVDTNSELWATISASGTISYATPTPCFAWSPRYYRVYQKDKEGLLSAGSNVVYGNIINSPPATPVITYPASDGDSVWSNSVLRWKCSDANNHVVRYSVLINYNNSGYIQFATDFPDTFVVLQGYDSLGFAFKVIACDSEGDSSGWSAERSAVIRNTVSDIDGNVYKVVRIGDQFWMTENLRTTKYNDNTDIPLVTDNSAWSNLTTPGYCWFNNTTDIAEHEKWGALYNWFAVNTGKLAPAGWRVPDTTDWNTLETYLIANGYNYDGTTTGNKIAKSLAAKTEWTTSTNTGAIGNDLSLNNRSGFSALAGGSRNYGGTFYYQSNYGYWWSATELDASFAYNRYLYSNYVDLYRNYNYKLYGFSVRLVRDLN